MPPPIEIIDVDLPIVVDLTLEIPAIHIDLTDEPDVEERAPPQPTTRPTPLRTRKVQERQNRTGGGLPSTVQIPDRRRLSLTSCTVPVLEPPLKRQRVEVLSALPRTGFGGAAIKLPSMPLLPVKGKGVKRELIELNSDGEDVDSKPKRIKREETPSSDEEELYERCHAGYDLNNEERWKPPKSNASKLTFDFVETFQRLTVLDPPSPAKCRAHPDFSDPPTYLCTKRVKWQHPQTGQPFPPPPQPLQSLLPFQLLRSSRRNVVQPMKLLASFKSAPGSINKIEQSNNWVAICSSANGGQPNEPGEELSRYNKEGGIMVWDNDVHILPGHRRVWDSYGSVKHYTVNDVKFDPCSETIVSSGNDKSLHIWTKGNYKPVGTWNYDHVPHELAFKPGSPVLAVAERKLMVYSKVSPEATVATLTLFGKKNKIGHIVGSIAWGRGPTSCQLFASSEPKKEDFTGSHKAFDVNRSAVAYEFDEGGSGDGMAVTNDGERLALITRRETSHPLRMYDVRRQNRKAVLFINLEPFPFNENCEDHGEVNSASFSADGIYLALGRNDNHTHVYDTRMLDRLLFDYEHHGPCRVNANSDSFGVVQVQWVKQQGIVPVGLVTGGNDGCVRFWDPLRSANSPQNGTVLAEMSSDVGAFSLGDRFEGERPLVVGDSAGEVSVFDIHPATFHHLYR